MNILLIECQQEQILSSLSHRFYTIWLIVHSVIFILLYFVGVHRHGHLYMDEMLKQKESIQKTISDHNEGRGWKKTTEKTMERLNINQKKSNNPATKQK